MLFIFFETGNRGVDDNNVRSAVLPWRLVAALLPTPLLDLCFRDFPFALFLEDFALLGTQFTYESSQARNRFGPRFLPT
jgi:hypothetical protein